MARPALPPPAAPAGRWFPVTVTTVNPLTVTFPDGSVHPGLGVPGLGYSSGGAYIASHQNGSIPVVFPASTDGTAAGTGTSSSGSGGLAAGTILDGNA